MAKPGLPDRLCMGRFGAEGELKAQMKNPSNLNVKSLEIELIVSCALYLFTVKKGVLM